MFFGQNGAGSFAELVAVDESRAGILHSTLSFEQGAAIGVPYFTAIRALKHVYVSADLLFRFPLPA